MNDKFFPEHLFELGYKDLISVIPPGAVLTPTSKIAQSSAGKAPGRRLASGLYAGYAWRDFIASEADVKQWCLESSSVGLLAKRFPGVDIDTMDATLAQIVEDAAVAKLGPAPLRVGRAPKRLLMYRTEQPFGRMRLFVRKGEEQHLIEILGEGQQYVVSGIHPVTQRAYEWSRLVPASELTLITAEQANEFLDYLKELLEMLSVGIVTRAGDGKTSRAAGDQAGLVAPSVEVLREAVEKIPNNDDLFPGRDEYVKMGYAIRAASGDELDEGYDIFAEWAARHASDGRVAGRPETWRSDWRRMAPPYSVGWSWIASQARPFGFNDAVYEGYEFEDAPSAPVEGEAEAARFSDGWLADQIVVRHRDKIRYSKQRGAWYVWQGCKWQEDAIQLADDIIRKELRRIADEHFTGRGATSAEIKDAARRAENICSAGKVPAVRSLVQMYREIALDLESLDLNTMVINTPQGIIDLATGEKRDPDPDLLCTKATRVAADFHAERPEWDRYLHEATGGDLGLQRYIKKLAGYCLTGETVEQQLTFIWGPGQNGKTVFLNVLTGILGDYAKTADMSTFTASNSEKHSTDVAMLAGARLVTASETQSGKRWDEAKVKALTGGEPVSARFMRQDFFTYTPQFKLVFIGNHKPELRDIDAAMRRRIQMVPFDVKPKVRDNLLGKKLEREWPAILAWFVEGCLEWQREGLGLPPKVQEFTDQYFVDVDGIGAWIRECVEEDAEATVTSAQLFDSWREYANANGEHVASQKKLSSTLASRGYERWLAPKTRVNGFRGIKIKDRMEPGYAM